ncbi:MAG: hypothetical protein HYS24_03685 [Ignavibacteriales bacterium]|nr:hypothetical protein [Ignavibacteriales bacterium]
MTKKIIVIMFIVCSITYSQKIKLTEIKNLELVQSYYPQFSNSNDKIIYTSSNYKGLFSYDLKNNQTVLISNENGAGYKPIVLDDNKFILRKFNIVNGIKNYSVYFKDVNSDKIELIQKDKRDLFIPSQAVNSNLIYVDDSKIQIKEIPIKNLSKSNTISRAVFSKNDKLFLIENDQKINISPLGKGVYVWESISKDGEKILFSFGNKGTFISDKEGQILFNIPDAHYPKFSPDENYILYMKDKDDGYKYISSDLYVFSLNEKKEFKLTETDDRIEMYPNWSTDQTKIVFNSDDGEIFIANINFEQ